MASPNIIAYLMLVIWPAVCWQLWFKLDPQRALIWTILGGYLIMPPLTAINFPAVPDLDKTTIPNLLAVAALIYVRKERLQLLPNSTLGRMLMLLYVLTPFGTVLTNTDPIYFAQDSLPGMRIYDSVAAVAQQLIYLLPFLLGRQLLGNPDGMKALLVALPLAGVLYSGPMIIEAFVSPQMNIWVYGFFQHDFFQTIRQGGFRPVVFLPHGLWVAFFALMCLLAALVRLRATPAGDRPKALLLVAFMFYLLLLCKSLGPLIYAVVAGPLILFLAPRWQILFAGVLAFVVVTYPLLRTQHLIPVQQIVAIAQTQSDERANSLQFRIDNEEKLLDHAAQRPYFGWGGYGRNFLHDPISGETTTIADGAWVIVLGIYGLCGYAAEFGLLTLSLLLLAKEALLRRSAPLHPYLAGVALIFAMNLVDLLPNATQIPFTWLLAGALLGEAERLKALRRDATAAMARLSRHGNNRPKKTVI